MSIDLLCALRGKDHHLHSPIDDLEPFCFTAQWAAAFNDGASGGRHNEIEIQRFREMIAGDRRAMAIILVQTLTPSFAANAGYGPFFAQFLALLTPWWPRLFALARGWSLVMSQADALEGRDKEKHLGLNFLIYGYRGVAEYFELVHEHRASLQGAI